MGLTSKLFAVFVGLLSFGLGLWLVGALCLLYVLVSSRPRRASNSPPEAHGPRKVQTRFLFALALASLSLVALASGGTLSPIILFSLALTAIVWPFLPIGPVFSTVVPVEDSILLRSAFLPFFWHGLAEVKPGAEDIPRALSSYAGTLLLVKKGGSVYARIGAIALDASRAETIIISKFRDAAGSISPGGAYLLPLDGKSSSDLFRLKLTRVGLRRGELAGQGADVEVLESQGGFVRKVGAYRIAGPRVSRAVLPVAGQRPPRNPLLWEVLRGIGADRRWPDPDRYSDLLHSVHATRGEPVAERFNGVEGSGPGVTVHGLGGDTLELSRPQLRAIMALYP